MSQLRSPALSVGGHGPNPEAHLSGFRLVHWKLLEVPYLTRGKEGTRRRRRDPLAQAHEDHPSLPPLVRPPPFGANFVYAKPCPAP